MFTNELFYLIIVIRLQRLSKMKEKCSKYEALFTFRTQEELNEHIQQCKDCRAEHEKMLRVSELIQEAKPYFKERRKNIARFKVASALFALMISGTTLGVLNLNTDISDTLKYGTTLSSEDLGLPVDSYGLISLE